MVPTDVTAAFDRALSSRRLLSHPYYRAWEAGTLTAADLAAYAGQYRHIERCLPDVLVAARDHIDDARPRQLVEANLADEVSRPKSHVELFEAFAAAVGVTAEAAPSEATARLVGLYRAAATDSAVAALAVVGAYEAQAAEIAAVKAESLRALYGLDRAGTEFWDVHADLDDLHAGWTGDALTGLGADPEAVREWAGRSADAWWAFLDERESARIA
jgi:pyrroloquinoline quinone (PQQ) biosynthesis protein C